MNIGRWAIVILGCLMFFGIGFKAGEFVEAGALIPGSNGDPLAAKSYVDKAVSEKLTQLQSQAEDLDAKIASLQSTVDKLEGKVGSSTSSNSSSPVVKNEPVTTEKPASPEISQPVEPATKPTGQNATITASSANIRKGPGTNYEVVAGILKGTAVPILKIEDTWLYVDLGNTKGWVSKNLVDIK